jgi:periplasmic copper chaperone A
MQSSMRSSAERLLALTTIVGLALAGTACSQPGARVDLHVSDPWVRASMGADNPTAGYMTIRNDGNTDDTLIGASIDGAERVELHRSMGDGSGMHGMEPVSGIDVPAGGSATLEPGGFHLMIFGLVEPLVVGDEVLITLTFEKLGTQTVLADVRSP